MVAAFAVIQIATVLIFAVAITITTLKRQNQNR